MKKYKKGYTTGVYDMFHIGHLNLLKNAKKQCLRLVVGVSTDELVRSAKNKQTIIPFEERIAIVRSIRYVDEAIPQIDYSISGKVEKAIELGADAVFVGTDWKGSDKWNEIEKKLKAVGIDVVYLPHTDGISSTSLRNLIENEKKQ